MARKAKGWTAGIRTGYAIIAATALAACDEESGGSGSTTSSSSAQLTATAAPAPTAPAPQPSAPQTSPVVVKPNIVSFATSAGTVAPGTKVTLSWQVEGADKLAITPTIGTVQSTSVVVAPVQTTTYELRATKGEQIDVANVVVAVVPTGDWVVVEKPPRLTNPRLVDVAKLVPQQMVAYSLHCAGLITQVHLGPTEDALVYMTGDKPLRYPLHITGGNNVRVVGVHIELSTQPGCGVGRLPNLPVATYPNANIHPRVPGGAAMRLQQAGVTFVEGVNMDLRGHEADCLISRNPAGMAGTVAKTKRDFIVQNTYCAGIEGLGQSKIGDGVHGDFWQNQGSPPENLQRVVFENVSVRTSQEGIILLRSSNGLMGAVELVMRRFDYSWDRRYVGDDAYEQFGLALSGYADKTILEDVRIDDYRDGGDYILLNDQRFGVSTASNVTAHPQIRSGLPQAGAFALPERTGVNYVSPHGGVPGT